MLVPLSWLREFTPYEGTAQALGDKLTMVGLEMEGILHPFANLVDIIIGYVAQCRPHPDSDHLHCCRVEMGQGELVDIVCGAPNVAEGQKVAVAPVGARLPDGTKIKKSKLRGQPSCGMICSERELGLSDDHSGIMVLPETVDIGHRLIDALNMERDVLDISITPNRADCLSILGIARETAMAFNLPFALPELPMILDPRAPEMTVPVEIEDPDLCWLYCGRIVSNVTMAPAPMGVRFRLLSVGQRPVSNIVDITNYILFECGQPLHAFDLDKLAGKRVIVRRARENEKFTTLDGKERQLLPSDLCICDAEKAVALAGVMGGLDSEITSESKNVFLESAVFQPQGIRKTSRRLGIPSEAAYRFERGVDQRRSIWAMDRACALMQSIADGLPNAGFSIAEPRPFIPKRISYRPARANYLLGVDISETEQAQFLENDGCAVENQDSSDWLVIQPSWRPDLTREADLIEETGRIYGLDAIPVTLPPIKKSINDNLGRLSQFGFFDRIRRWGAGIGLNEAINYSFVGESDLDFLNLPKEGRIAIANPLSDEQNTLRTQLAPGLLRDLANNLAFGANSVRLFEIAEAFNEDANAETRAREVPFLGIMLYGARQDQGWPRIAGDLDYTDIKGLLVNLFGFFKLGELPFASVDNHAFLAPCVSVKAGNLDLAQLGRVKPAIAKAWHAQKDVWLAEINLAILRHLAEKAATHFRPLPIYPPVRRDITVITPTALSAGIIREKILLRKLPLLEGATLVDCFEPEGSDERHLTWRLTFRHPERTLKDSEVDKEREKVAEFLRQELNVKI